IVWYDDIRYGGVVGVGHVLEGAVLVQFSQERHGDRIGEGDTDGSGGLGRRVLLADRIHRHHERLAGGTDVVVPAGRPVDPEVRLGRVVARHVAVVVHINESDVKRLLSGKIEI